MSETLNLHNHVIICGLRPTAVHIIEELEEAFRLRGVNDGAGAGLPAPRDYVAIDRSEERIRSLKHRWGNAHYIHGDATDDEVLERACLREAYGIFPVLPVEKENLYIILTARQLNPGIRIVASTADPFNLGQKLVKAGANSVISPNFIGGMRLVSEMVRPHVTAFLDEMLREKGSGLHILECPVEKGSGLVGKDLQTINLPGRAGLLVLAVQKKGEEGYIYNPPAHLMVADGDILVVMGSPAQLQEAQILRN